MRRHLRQGRLPGAHRHRPTGHGQPAQPRIGILRACGDRNIAAAPRRDAREPALCRDLAPLNDTGSGVHRVARPLPTGACRASYWSGSVARLAHRGCTDMGMAMVEAVPPTRQSEPTETSSRGPDQPSTCDLATLVANAPRRARPGQVLGRRPQRRRPCRRARLHSRNRAPVPIVPGAVVRAWCPT